MILLDVMVLGRSVLLDDLVKPVVIFHNDFVGSQLDILLFHCLSAKAVKTVQNDCH